MYQLKWPSSNGTQHPDRSNVCEATSKNLIDYGYYIIHAFDPWCSRWLQSLLSTLDQYILICVSTQLVLWLLTRTILVKILLNWNILRHTLHWLGVVKLISTHTPTSQVLDCTQKSSNPELEIQIVWHQSTVSCL